MQFVIRDLIPGKADADSLAHVLIKANEDAFRGLVPDQCLDFSEEESSANWQKFFAEGFPEKDHMIMVENADGAVIGYAWCRPASDASTYRSELYQISVLPGYQGQGVGRLLVSEIARRLIDVGIHSMKVRVLKVNPNRAFYERLGGEFVSEQPYDWDGVILPEYTYGWKDIKPLFGS